MLNNALYSEAKKAHEEVEAARPSEQHGEQGGDEVTGPPGGISNRRQGLLEAVDIKRRSAAGQRCGSGRNWSWRSARRKR